MAAKVKRTIEEINQKIKQGKAVVLNAQEMTRLVRSSGKVKAAQEVDVVTTGTFSPMCSSGLFFNIGQDPPTMKVSSLTLNSVPCYSGIAAVDCYLGATEPTEDDPLNKVYPGGFKYGGGHVIEDLLLGKKIALQAKAYGTDCYPRKSLEKDITLSDLKQAIMLNPRNGYQNYNCAVNLENKIRYTYLGPLKGNMGNVNFATAGELSPLFNDPYFQTIGLGTRIFLGGGPGYVLGSGTQHNKVPARNKRGIPMSPAGTLMLRGELAGMDPRYVRGVSVVGYGCSLAIGLGIPIPVLNEEIAWFAGVGNDEIHMPVVDYAHDYPQGVKRVLEHVSYADLFSGEITVKHKKVPAVPLTSYSMSLEVADSLKSWIENGQFLLGQAQEKIESS